MSEYSYATGGNYSALPPLTPALERVMLTGQLLYFEHEMSLPDDEYYDWFLDRMLRP